MKAEGRRQKAEENGVTPFRLEGFQILADLISTADCEALATDLSELFEQKRTARNKIGGIRNLLHTNEKVAALALSHVTTLFLSELTCEKYFPVRAIFFDKTAKSNWGVPWHQDLAIAVAERVEVAGFSGWSVKDGVVHVHPPCEILDRMVILRLHLDDCGSSNGALKVIPRSHQHGKLGSEEIDRFASAGSEILCEVSKGGALVMRPLLLHASSPAENPSHRRVLHIEYAATALPGGLRWIARQ